MLRIVQCNVPYTWANKITLSEAVKCRSALQYFYDSVYFILFRWLNKYLQNLPFP